MANPNNSANQNYVNNSDGWQLSGGTTPRKLTVTGADVTITGSGSNTYTFPGSSDTLAGLGTAQTWSAAQTFNSSDFKLAGSSSGTTIINAAATASGTLTLPAATDTLVGKATTDTLTNKDMTDNSNLFYIWRDYEALMGMGTFDIWWDGTSFSSPNSGTFVATLCPIFFDGTKGTFTISQAGGPLSTGATNALEWNQTVAGSGNTYRLLRLPREDASLWNTHEVTLSFYVKAAANTSVEVQVNQYFGSGGSPSATVTALDETVTATTTNTLHTYTFTMPSTASKTFGSDENDCIHVDFLLPPNSTFDVLLQEVRLDRGPNYFPYQWVPLAMKWNYIERYYQINQMGMGFVASAANQYNFYPVPYKTTMRNTPSITSSAGVSRVNVGGLAFEYISNYGATAYLYSAGSGQVKSEQEIVKLDARLS